MFRRKVQVRVGTDKTIDRPKTCVRVNHQRITEQLAIRIGCLLLASIGITKYKFLSISLGTLVGFSFISILVHKSLTIHNNFFSNVMTFSQIIIDLISWYLTIKTNKEIFSSTQSLLKVKRVTRFSYISCYTIASIFLSPSLTFTVSTLYTTLTTGNGYHIQFIIKSMYPDYKDQYLGVLVIADIISFHMQFCAIFFIVFMYALNCILIYERTTTISKKSIAADALEALWICRCQVMRVRALEEAFCIPIFFVFVKVSLQILTTILYISAYPRDGTEVIFGTIAAQYSGMFLLIVLTADAVQSRCQSNLETVFFCTRKFEAVGIRLGYFDYVRLDGWNRLTAWKVVNVNRQLMLTAIASAVTYGVVIAQIKGT